MGLSIVAHVHPNSLFHSCNSRGPRLGVLSGLSLDLIFAPFFYWTEYIGRSKLDHQICFDDHPIVYVQNTTSGTGTKYSIMLTLRTLPGYAAGSYC